MFENTAATRNVMGDKWYALKSLKLFSLYTENGCQAALFVKTWKWENCYYVHLLRY